MAGDYLGAYTGEQVDEAIGKVLRGEIGGAGVPAGGSTGQVLAKKTDGDYDTQWVDPPEGGGTGEQGPPGEDGADGKSAYEIAVDNGFSGTEQEWLASLVGPQGPAGEGLSEAQADARYLRLTGGTVTGTVNISGDSSQILINSMPVATEEKVQELISESQGTTGGVGEATEKNAEIFNDYQDNRATGSYAHAEGSGTIASGAQAHASGLHSIATPEKSAMRVSNIETSTYPGVSVIEGSPNESSLQISDIAVGDEFWLVTAEGIFDIVITANDGKYLHYSEPTGANLNMAFCYIVAKRSRTTDPFNDEAAHAEGSQCAAMGNCAHAEGYVTQAGLYAHSEGYLTVASGQYSHAQGYSAIAQARYQTAMGTNNVASSSETDKLIIGKGTASWKRANAFRVTDTGTYASGNYNSSGADYAELFQWADNNPKSADRCGLFVTLQGDKIKLAGPDSDYILGIVSGSPSVVGDVYDDQWQGMYLSDVYGRPIMEEVEVPEEAIEVPDPEDSEKTIRQVIIPAHKETRQKLNPAYNPAAKYIPRTKRPEWDAVGMLGKLVARDDGSCQVDGYCAPGRGGVAAHSAERTAFRVIERLDDRHIRVLIK